MKENLDNIKVIVTARLGSNRVKAKNLRFLNGRPLISYILRTLKSTENLRNIYLNSDSELFKHIADEEGVKFYHRNAELGTSASLIDDLIYDFIKSENPDHVAFVCPTSPFVEAAQFDSAWKQYADSDCDTLLSCERIQTHCFFDGKPLNFSTDGKHPRSQDLEPVRALNFAICIWDAKKYVANYEANGCGVYTGKLGFCDTDGFACIDIDYPEDFDLAELIAKHLESGQKSEPRYPDYLEELLSAGQDIAN